MSVQEIEKAIENLPVREVHELADWLAERQNQLWDTQIEEDAKAGRLDALINSAKDQNRQGLTRPL
ncbi:hypothetical protein [Spirosoma endbachense]|uniref:Uncharacterized protein n=1 Tax=Spirosoma endbachense TaxID=2666025 RepID=A0A6P1VYK2_9BACT|nr:hypothetical protein [Spirosoma endbachense]QHV96837.1 hypothetical protein GJR95_18280 [Spirosoma endbachense]